MDDKIALSKEDEEFLDSLLKESEYVCVSCLSPTEVDYEQTQTYCEFCEAYTEVKERHKA